MKTVIFSVLAMSALTVVAFSSIDKASQTSQDELLAKCRCKDGQDKGKS